MAGVPGLYAYLFMAGNLSIGGEGVLSDLLSC